MEENLFPACGIDSDKFEIELDRSKLPKRKMRKKKIKKINYIKFKPRL